MSNDQIQNLTQQLNADPQNEALIIALLHARSRIAGDQVFFEVLQDPQDWDLALESVRNLAAESAQNRPGTDYRFLGLMSFQCTREHRLASFEHLPTGIVLRLILGGPYEMGIRQRQYSMDSFAMSVHRVVLAPFFLGATPTSQR